MTTEEQFKAIIQAQVKGGYEEHEAICGLAEDEWAIFLSPPLCILEILLDPAGLKAAYGSLGVIAGLKKGYDSLPDGEDKFIRYDTPYWQSNAQTILKAWLLSEGDAAHTIETAFYLLP